MTLLNFEESPLMMPDSSAFPLLDSATLAPMDSLGLIKIDPAQMDTAWSLLSMWAIFGPLLTLLIGIVLTHIFKRRNFAFQIYRQTQIEVLADLYAKIVLYHDRLETGWKNRHEGDSISAVLTGLGTELKAIETVFRHNRIYLSPAVIKKLEKYFKNISGISMATALAGIITPIDTETGDVALDTVEWSDSLIEGFINSEIPDLLNSIERLVRKNIK